MSFLRGLRDYYVASDTYKSNPRLYAEAPFHFILDIDKDGNFLGMVPVGERKGAKYTSKKFLAPAIRNRGSSTNPRPFADNGEYVFGITKIEKPNLEDTKKRHTAFKSMVQEYYDTTKEPSVGAILKWLENCEVELPEDYDTGFNTIIRVDGVMPHTLPSVQNLWSEKNKTEDVGRVVRCLVCGEMRTPIKKVPTDIKTLIPGGDTRGMGIVSVKSQAFMHYGMEGSEVTSLCAECAEFATAGLDLLLKSETNRVFIGESVYVFWTRFPETPSFLQIAKQPSKEEVKALLESARRVNPEATNIDTDAFYCAELRGNGGRLVLKDYIETTVGDAKENIVRWFERQELVDYWGGEGYPVGIGWLAECMYSEGAKVPANVYESLVRSALKGKELPRSFLNRSASRIGIAVAKGDSDKKVVRPLIVLMKALLDGEEKIMPRLDDGNENIGYLCGRLFAVLESIQYNAMGSPNSTIVDQYYRSASIKPSLVFGNLLSKITSAHMTKLRKNKPGAYFNQNKRLEDILERIDNAGGFPQMLSLDDSAEFSIGFYLQKAEDRRVREDKKNKKEATSQDVGLEQEEESKEGE